MAYGASARGATYSDTRASIVEMIPAFAFEKERLDQLAEKYGEVYRTADPFPHVVMDNFLDEEVANLLYDEFPGIESDRWKLWGPGKTKRVYDKNIEKVGLSDDRYFGDFTRHFMHELHSHVFLKFLENLTEMKDYIPDPSYNGCGLHSTGRGGKLMIHTDSNRHLLSIGRSKDKDANLLHQHVNLIYYLNKDWDERWGGNLELWDREKTHCVSKVAPLFNRAVLFETSRFSYHGHPHPLQCPEDRRRNSLAVYYYIPNRPTDEKYAGLQKDVEWVPTTPAEKRWVARQKWINRAKLFIPPIVLEAPKLFSSKR